MVLIREPEGTEPSKRKHRYGKDYREEQKEEELNLLVEMPEFERLLRWLDGILEQMEGDYSEEQRQYVICSILRDPDDIELEILIKNWEQLYGPVGVIINKWEVSK
jgi:hypothetical protein